MLVSDIFDDLRIDISKMAVGHADIASASCSKGFTIIGYQILTLPQSTLCPASVLSNAPYKIPASRP